MAKKEERICNNVKAQSVLFQITLEICDAMKNIASHFMDKHLTHAKGDANLHNHV